MPPEFPLQALPEEAQQGAVESASESPTVVPQTWFWLSVATVAHGEVQRPRYTVSCQLAHTNSLPCAPGCLKMRLGVSVLDRSCGQFIYQS